MRISVITVATYKDPRFADMARVLATSFESVGGAELEWIVVDLLEERIEEFENAAEQLEGGYLFEPGLGLNEARNLALSEASGDYVVFLSDCTLVTASFARVVEAAAELGLGARFNTRTTTQWPIPEGGRIHDFESCEVTFVPCAAASAAGIAFGAPMEMLEKIAGNEGSFDVAYDGGVGYSDTDVCIRLGRAGVQFATSPRGWVIQQLSYSTQESTRSVENKKTLNALIKDRERIVPSARKTENLFAEPSDRILVVTPAQLAGTDDEPAPNSTPKEVPGDLDPADEQSPDVEDTESVAHADGDDGSRDLSDSSEPDVETE